ncbi:hypothetical protein KMW28_24460 [Flammeovirga yaeyamensis]|uniref:Transmembrane protein n=1 Tax=Flammeovirga yaeyamensis TaxID=367791 RepID=A0AAX1N928_9BACT|nr:hypothetical protein [Flammeovirga yaeyamensis]MBB3699561.1 putative membrane protein [Flammeovirga yaeyamensis]NMF35184.1 hypothetical protein [Flammeovirga yaeyamensis]QWG04048.1 hypothetical protein KMW28_24460 [Flammeovirga yaeyamensis]
MNLSHKVSIHLKLAHYFSFSLTGIIAIIFINFNIGLRGKWTSRMIILIFFLSGILFHLIAEKEAMKKWGFWYFKGFSFLPIGISLFTFIPFLGPVIVFSILGQLFIPVDKIYYEDDQLKVQTRFVGVLGPPQLEVYQKEFIFEKRITDHNAF